MHTIEFELTPEQFTKAIRRKNQHLLRAMPARWLFALLSATLAGGFAFLLIYTSENLNGLQASIMRPVWLATLITVAAYALYVLYYRYGMNHVLRHNRRWVGNRTHLSLDEEGMRTASTHGEAFTPWSAIQGVEQADDLLLLHLDSLYFLPVPANAFASPEDKDAFVAFAQEHIAPETTSTASLASSAPGPAMEEQAAQQTPTRPAFPLKSGLRAILNNAAQGFRLLFFLRVPEERIVVGWWQIPVFALLGIVLALAWSFFQIGPKGQFMWYSLPTALFHVPVLLVAAIFIALALHRADRTQLLVQAFFMIAFAFDVFLGLLFKALPFNMSDFSADMFALPFFSLPSLWLALACFVAARRYVMPTFSRRFLGMVITLVFIAWPLGAVYRQLPLWTTPYDESRDAYRYGLSNEDTFYSQQKMLDRELAALQPERPGVSDVFFIGMAGYGEQDVFMKEVDSVARLFRERFDAEGHTIRLVNNNKSLASSPIASATSLKAALNRVAQVMNKDEDILFLFLTSHGSESHQFALELWPLNFNPLDPKRLRKLLDESGIKHRVVVVSACYSGGFINALKDDNTLVISASAPDRNSFGCGNTNDWTYFGEAYFNEALRKTRSFPAAFESALPQIAAREKKEKFKPSNPQMALGPAMRDKLAQLEQQLASGGQASATTRAPSEPESPDPLEQYVNLVYDPRLADQDYQTCLGGMQANGPEASLEQDPNYFAGLNKSSAHWLRLATAWNRYAESYCAQANDPALVRRLFAKHLRAQVPPTDVTPVLKFFSSGNGKRWHPAEREAIRQMYTELARIQASLNAPLSKAYQAEQTRILDDFRAEAQRASGKNKK